MPSDRGPWGCFFSYDLRAVAGEKEKLPLSFPIPLRWDRLTNGEAAKRLSLTNLLGFPIICSLSAFTAALLNLYPAQNLVIKALSLDCDPKSETFGEPLLNSDKSHFVFARADGHDLMTENLKIMMRFVEVELADLVHYGEPETEQDEEGLRKAEEALKKATPVNFKKFYEEYRSQHAEEMEKIESLYADVAPICKSCGKTGSELMKCSGCKKVNYCSKECQKKDWKLHKSVFHRA